MRDLRVIWRLMRKLSNRWLKPAPPTHSISLIDPTEFSDLIRSGRKKDLKTLAKRLSEHHGRSRVKVVAKSFEQGIASPKNDRAG